jgi:DNA-binding NarL/FixJ family response regulator
MIKNILLIEDHPANQAWLEKCLNTAFSYGCTIDKALDLQQAKALLNSQSYDLTLLDIGLPDGSGLELLQGENAAMGKKVITTIFDDDEHVFEALKLGIDGYLIKSESIDNLVNLLTGILENRPALSSLIANKILCSFQSKPSKTRSLTQREIDVLCAIAQGESIKQIAKTLGLSPFTVSGYVKTIYRKLNIHSKAQAATIAQQEGLI